MNGVKVSNPTTPLEPDTESVSEQGGEIQPLNLSDFTALFEYSSTLTGAEGVLAAQTEVFPAVYALALSDLERESVLKAVSRACEVNLTSLRSTWKAYLKTHESEQGDTSPLNQADRLVSMALKRCTLFHDPDGVCYADITREGHRETYRLREKSFKEWLAREFYESEKKAPSAQALQDALGVLEGKAKFDGLEHRVYVRLAPLEHEGELRVLLDLGGPQWSAVEVDSSGWRVLTVPPVRFRRPKNLQPLAFPVAGGHVSELLEVLNIPADTFHLLACWLVGTLRPGGPYALLELIGGQGTSKSTTARFIKSLIDPSQGALRTTPRNEEDLMIAAQGQHILCYDNLSSVPVWLSDALCRLATGGGLSKRELYSDDGEVTLEAMRPVILTGISEMALRPDLLDRTVRLELPLIPAHERRPVEEVEARFKELAPRVLGALLEAVSLALKDRAQVARDLKELPRMADFAVWVTAAEPALGATRGDFLREYRENRAQGDNAALEGHSVPPALAKLMEGREEWTGLPAELLSLLEQGLDAYHNGNPKKPKDWPQTPKALSDILRRYGPVLHSAAQLEVTFKRRTNQGLPVHILKRQAQAREGLPDRESKTHTPHTLHTLERAAQQKPGVHGGVRAEASGGAHTPDLPHVHSTYTPTYTEENTVPASVNGARADTSVCGVRAQPLLSGPIEVASEWGGEDK